MSSAHVATQTGMHARLVSLFRHKSRRGDIQTRGDIQSFHRHCFWASSWHPTRGTSERLTGQVLHSLYEGMVHHGSFLRSGHLGEGVRFNRLARVLHLSREPVSNITHSRPGG